jgi:hypothetical protein
MGYRRKEGVSEKLVAVGGGACPVRRRESRALARTEFGVKEYETVHACCQRSESDAGRLFNKSYYSLNITLKLEIQENGHLTQLSSITVVGASESNVKICARAYHLEFLFAG